MSANNSKIHDLALSFTPGVGVVTLRNLVSHFGSSQAVLEATEESLRLVEGVGSKLSTAIKNNHSAVYERAEKEIAFTKRHNIQVLSLSDVAYPRRLKECYDAPSILYYRGNADLNSSRVVSIVGSRKATFYGKNICDELVEALAAYNVLVVSGLAYGIDSFAHKASVDHKIPTIGVLGHGLDQIYPASNRNLAMSMLENGGLLSEFPFNTRPDRQNFPQRNRIIAGMADVVIVVEAAIQGGALITAEIANNYNRDVCAFPGNVNQEYSAGCNFLIKSHRAHLISRAKDLEYLMNWEQIETKVKPIQIQMDLSLSTNEKRVYELVKLYQPLSIDEISTRLKLAQSKLTITLLELEMKGLLVALPGKVFRTIA
jgi:DNA processing protein